MAFLQGWTGTTGLAAATSANGTTRNGASLPLNRVEPGSLLVECTSAITTSSVAATFTPQVSRDGGTTWWNLKGLENPALVATATGTGTEVVTRLALVIPPSASSELTFRCNAVLAGAATAAADQTTVTYRYRLML